MNPYETEKILHEYLLFHYGAPEEVLPWPEGPRSALNYAVRCVTECVDVGALPHGARALDVGCAVGRSSFELARFCTEVVGVDFSQRFIEAAQTLRAKGSVAYARVEEGDLSKTAVAVVPPEIERTRVRFLQGDAQALPAELGTFDVVLAANLIDRLSRPRSFLSQLPRLVKAGGQLILTSPYTWLDEYTPRHEWVGGLVQEGREQRTLDGLKAALGGGFDLVGTKDLPFLIREHARKFQWSVAQASIWRRKDNGE